MLVHAPIIGRLRHRPRRWASRRIARGDYGPVIRRGTGSRFPGAKPPSLSLYSLPKTGMAYQQCSIERSEGTRIIRAPSSQLPDYLSQNHSLAWDNRACLFMLRSLAGCAIARGGGPADALRETSVRSADQKRESLPITRDEKGALPIARRRKR
jgi:hypothetical protein